MAFIIFTGCFNVTSVKASESLDHYFANGKEILFVVFYTDDGFDIENILRKDCDISIYQINQLKDLALTQHNNNNEVKKEYRDRLSEDDISEYNKIVVNESLEIISNMKRILGKKYT